MRSLRLYSLFTLLTVSWLVAGGMPSLLEEEHKVEKKAEDVLRQMTEYYKGLKSFSVDLSFSTVAQAPGIRREMWNKYEISIKQPNKAAFVLRDGMGVSLVSDGKTFYTFVPPLNKFTQEEAPQTLESLFAQDEIGLVSRTVGNMLFIDHLLKMKPYDRLAETFNNIAYIGLEEVDGKKMDHLRLTQSGVDWELFIEHGKTPLVRRLTADMSKAMAESAPEARDVKMEVTVKFGDWKTNADIPDERFAFTPPADARKVASLYESDEHAKLIGKELPSLKLAVMGGADLNTSDLKGKIVVLEVWASWCVPCVQVLPILQDVTRRYKDKDVVLITINQSEEPEVVQAFLKKRGLDVKVALDPDGRLAAALGLTGIPFTAVIGRDGKIQAVHSGATPDLRAKLSQEIETLLAGKTLVSYSF